MKQALSLLVIIVFVFCGCTYISNQNKFDSYSDSLRCADKCLKNQKFGTPEYEYWYKEEGRFIDSEEYYFNLISPSPSKNEIETPKNCNCK